MLGFLKRVKASVDARRLRRRNDDEQSPDAFAELCRRLVTQGRWDEAYGVAKDGLRRFPRSPVLQDQARLLWKRNDHDAYRALEAEYEATPADESASRLVEHLLEAGEIDLAVDVAGRHRRAAPASSAAAALEATALERRFARDLSAADGAAALDALRSAAELNPGDADVRARLGDLLAFVGAKHAAKEAFDAAAAVRPDEPRFAADAAALDGAAPDEDEGSLLLAVERESRDAVPDEAAAGRACVELGALAAVQGVRRLAYAGAGAGPVLFADAQGARAIEAAADPFANFVAALRPQFVSAVKRLGAGAFQEAEMVAERTRVLAYAGATGLLAVEVEARLRPENLAPIFRAFVARRDAAEQGDD